MVFTILFPKIYILNTISIHTPTQGVTCIRPQDHIFVKFISIHTPTQGVTRARSRQRLTVTHFNPHSHAGSDKLQLFY